MSSTTAVPIYARVINCWYRKLFRLLPQSQSTCVSWIAHTGGYFVDYRKSTLTQCTSSIQLPLRLKALPGVLKVWVRERVTIAYQWSSPVPQAGENHESKWKSCTQGENCENIIWKNCCTQGENCDSVIWKSCTRGEKRESTIWKSCTQGENRESIMWKSCTQGENRESIISKKCTQRENRQFINMEELYAGIKQLYTMIKP